MTALTTLAKERRLGVIDDLKPGSSRFQDRAMVERVLADARRAERFIIGDDASFALGRWVAGCEDLLLDNRQFAKAPFENTYVELTIRKVHSGMDRPKSGPDETADDRLGFLITGNRVRTVCTSLARPGNVGMGLWQYWLDTPETERLTGGPVPREELGRLALLLGSTVHALKDEEQRMALVNGIRIRSTLTGLSMDERVIYREKLATRFMAFVADAAGEMRTLWAALLLINQHRQHIRMSQMPRQTGITPKGRKVFMAHTLIDIPISSTPQEMRRIFYPATRASPVAHPVRGHWVRFNLQKGCAHQYPAIPDDDGRYHCARCGGWLRWRKDFTKGDAGAGFNLHTYEVTP